MTTNGSDLIGYADAGYLSDPHKSHSQTGYVFTYNDTAISWRSTKQTLVATSSNHSEIFALHEASRECVWLRSVIQHIQSTCQLPPVTNSPTVIYEDNAACIAQIKGGTSKGTERSIYHQNSFTLMNSKKVDKLMSDRYVLQIILQIYLLSLYQHQLSRRWYMVLVCVDFTNYKSDSCIIFRGRIFFGHMCTALFFP